MIPKEEQWEELPGGKALTMGKPTAETTVLANRLACQEECEWGPWPSINAALCKAIETRLTALLVERVQPLELSYMVEEFDAAHVDGPTDHDDVYVALPVAANAAVTATAVAAKAVTAEAVAAKAAVTAKAATAKAVAANSKAPPTVFIADSPEGWLHPQSAHSAGLLVKRPLDCRWDGHQHVIDELMERFGGSMALRATAENGNPEDLAAQVDQLVEKAGLPADLAEQVRGDACRLGATIGPLTSDFTSVIEVRLEIFGDNVCRKWHQDFYGGRAIVSYTGEIGTEYTSHENVDMWELENCGNEDCIIRDKTATEAVDVGDMLFMKGTEWPTGAKGLVHKSPSVRYHDDGRVVNRLVLKLDVPGPGPKGWWEV